MRQKSATLLDSNAGAPLHPFVVEALRVFLPAEKAERPRFLGNPSSIHSFGRDAASEIEAARLAILKTLGASPEEWQVTFTSGGSEANQLAVMGTFGRALRDYRRGGASNSPDPRPKWVVSGVEHSCVRVLVEPLRREGVEIVVLPTRPDGEPDLRIEALEGATLVSILGVGNETGIFHHYQTSHILSAENVSQNRPSYHTDFVAGWGKGDLDLSTSPEIDFVSIAAQKLGGLTGCGALIHRRSLSLEPQILGNQQSGLRGGTENLFGILSLRALAERWAEVRVEIDGLSGLRDRFETELRRRFPRVVVTGGGRPRAPHLSHFFLPGFSKDLSLVPQLDLQGFALSSGSACASRTVEPSEVLLAMGVKRIDALNALRVSLYPGNRWEELESFLDALEKIVARATDAEVRRSS